MPADPMERRALVTGASRGIGLEIARTLAREGFRVALNARDPEVLERAALSVRASVAVQGDVTIEAGAADVVARATHALGALDVVVCNVGSGRSVPPGTETAAEWARMLSVNLFSATNVVAAARSELARTGGVIVCVSSICGQEVVPAAPVAYSAAKAALNAFVRGMARPLGTEGIRICAVAPGNIVFEGSSWDDRVRRDPAEVQQMLERDVSLRRLGTPGDIAAVVAFLASGEASFATGSVWVADGGQVRA